MDVGERMEKWEQILGDQNGKMGVNEVMGGGKCDRNRK